MFDSSTCRRGGEKFMPENLFLAQSLLTNPEVFTWIVKDVNSEKTKSYAGSLLDGMLYLDESV